MLKICLALSLTVSLGCLAQPPQRRSSGLTQRDEGEASPRPRVSHPQRVESRPLYTAQGTVSTAQPDSRQQPQKTDYRRRPKKAYYPKIISFYQKPTANNGYVTDDGVQRAERGYLSPRGVWTVEGSVTSLAEDNVAVVQSYIADDAGYKSSVRRYAPEKYRSLDDFVPWASDDFEDDNKLGSGTIGSLVG